MCYAVRSANEVGGLQKNGSALLPRHVGPIALGLQSRVYGGFHVLGIAVVAHAQQVLVLVRRRHLPLVLRFHGLPSYPHRRVQAELDAAVVFSLKLLALRAAGCVAQHGFVTG
jgi:hypothetical protein